MTKSDAWVQHDALKDFYYSCPNDWAWRKYRSTYLQAHKEWMRLRKALTKVYGSRWEGTK